MAKATAKCKCVECGTTFEKTKDCYNRTEANNWEKWAEQNYTQCPQCWGKEQRKKENEKPLTLTININPFELENPIVLVFTGNTMENKDNIKSIGYYWQEQPMIGTLGLFDRRKLNWNKRTTIDDLDNEIQKAESIGAKIENKITDIDLIAYNQVKEKEQQKQNKKAEFLKDIQKPICPDILQGKKWNQKIYGRSGSYCFYCNNEKISITDQEAKEIEKYLKEKEAYKKAVAEIEKTL